MPSLYYFAGWTDSHSLVGCNHRHETVVSAVACCTSAGAYVVAVEDGELRELNEKEDLQFRYAMYGWDTGNGRFLTTILAVFAYFSRFVGLHS
jgi:hypothetical protein